MAYVPIVRALAGGGGFGATSPSIVWVNFDPTLTANDSLVRNLPDGTLIIQNGAPGEDCTLSCEVQLFIKNCSTCTDAVINVLGGISGDVALDANGAVVVPSTGGLVRITKGSAGAYTLAAPTVEENGKTLTIVSNGAYAHTVTQASPGFNNAGGTQDVATFAAAIGNSISLIASNGVWIVTNLQGVTLG